MTKDELIGRIMHIVHEEVKKIEPGSDRLAEGLKNAGARGPLLSALTEDAMNDSHDAILNLMDIMSDHDMQPVYPEIRVIQQWQKMLLTNQPLDNYYEVDLIFSQQRAGMPVLVEDLDYLHAHFVDIKDLESLWPSDWPIEERHPKAIERTLIAKALPEVEGSHAAIEVFSKPVALPDTTTTVEEQEPATGISSVVLRTPAMAYQEKRSIVEDLALMNGIAIVSGKEWRQNKMERSEPILVADFDFSTIARDGVGRAAYLLVGPSLEDDVRIELKSQSTAGSAGDKLPTSLLRLVNASKTHSYGRAVIGVVGLQFFAPESLALAREVASKTTRVQLVEGFENFTDAILGHIVNVKNSFEAQRSKSVRIEDNYDSNNALER